MTPGSLQPTLGSQSHSLKRQVRSRGAQRWAFKLSYAKRTRDEMAPLIAFAVAARGQFVSFLFVPPVIGNRRAGSGAPIVRISTEKGRSVPVHGVAAGATIGKVGDYVKFANGTKVYMLTADAQANGSGQVDLAIEPALYAGVTAGEAVILDNVPFTVAFAADLHETPISPPQLYSWDCELVEVLP
jgi:hypothetical protein